MSQPTVSGSGEPFPDGPRFNRHEALIGRLLENDQNGDQALSRDEIPRVPPFVPVLREFGQLDRDGNGFVIIVIVLVLLIQFIIVLFALNGTSIIIMALRRRRSDTQ